MKIEAYPITDFQKIELILYNYYGLDKLELSNAIYYAKEQLLNDSEEASKVDSDKWIYLPLSPHYNISRFHDFCSHYNIGEDSLVAKVLSFVYMFFPIETASDLDTEYLEYVTMVRPEMLKLYIALHSGEHRFNHKCRVTFDKESVSVDSMRPWLQMELERYLDKYLGVKDVNEAEKELLAVYGGKYGRKQNKDEARIIWGTYHLLQQSVEFRTDGERVVSRLQSRIIADFLICCGLRKIFEIDEEKIRSRLNSYLELFDSVGEFIANTHYKLSPNNDSGRYY